MIPDKVDGQENIGSDPDVNLSKLNNETLLSQIFTGPGKEFNLNNVLSSSRTKFRDFSDTRMEKPKRKRKIFSCDSCRKMKTKCVINSTGQCQRCLKYQINCSLYNAKGEKLIGETVNSNSDKSILENKINVLTDKVNFLVELQQQSQMTQKSLEAKVQRLDINFDMLSSKERVEPNFRNSATPSSHRSESISSNTSTFLSLPLNLPHRNDDTAPLNLIAKIKNTLFVKGQNSHDSSKFKEANNNFIEFFLQNEAICIELSKQFLEISHYYIIPGGISAIDKDYVLEHPFITCTFVAISVLLNKKYRQTKFEKQINELLNGIVSTVTRRESLSDHDVESILYVCMYNFGKFDKWMLSAIGLMHFFNSIDTINISNRVIINKEYLDDDLFHLRVLNGLCACHTQHAVGKGRMVMISDVWSQIYKLTIAFPKATIGDAIQVAQLELFEILTTWLNDKKLYGDISVIKTTDDKADLVLEVEELERWYAEWDKIIAKDVSKICNYCFAFAYMLIARKFYDLVEEGMEVSFGEEVISNTIIYYSYELLKTFLESQFDIIRGIPSFQLSEIVYGCITLFELLPSMATAEKNKTLNVITRIYWHLNKMGQEVNEATNTIAQIVKQLAEMASKDEVLLVATEADKGFIGSGSIVKNHLYKGKRNTQQQRRLVPEDLPTFNFESKGVSIPSSIIQKDSGPVKDYRLFSKANHFPNPSIKDDIFQLPDLSGFENFDDFFQGLFPANFNAL